MHNVPFRPPNANIVAEEGNKNYISYVLITLII